MFLLGWLFVSISVVTYGLDGGSVATGVGHQIRGELLCLGG